ncbi:hypothetical protein G7Y89_g2286 [Cudoniella acicularis]|uniref:Uncharacterized protein n=1 Tax=Cudoniella acicularis TaxID=354080 RepID=A0A8H4W682_9HELO|nr:hypothetical protein G7Y89_g2286 [Cudoniella acicularis]
MSFKLENMRQWLVAAVMLLTPNLVLAFNAPADVPTWCGKPYMSTNQALDPGGQFQFPTPSKDPLLYLTVQPRYTIFLESDEAGSFIVDASISYTFGEPLQNVNYQSPNHPGVSLDFKISNDENRVLLVSNSIPVNSTGNLFSFPLSAFTPRLAPYPITIRGTLNQQTFTSTTTLYILPSRTYGSAVKIDNLHGGLYVQNPHNNYEGWYAVFPVGYYADGGYVTPPNTSFTNLDTYAAQGFNTINIVPDGGLPDQSYPVSSLQTYWDHLDALNLFNLYDMRFAFQNSTRISTQVALWKDRPTLLSWYTADEPDGYVSTLFR